MLNNTRWVLFLYVYLLFRDYFVALYTPFYFICLLGYFLHVFMGFSSIFKDYSPNYFFSLFLILALTSASLKLFLF